MSLSKICHTTTKKRQKRTKVKPSKFGRKRRRSNQNNELFTKNVFYPLFVLIVEYNRNRHHCCTMTNKPRKSVQLRLLKNLFSCAFFKNHLAC